MNMLEAVALGAARGLTECLGLGLGVAPALLATLLAAAGGYASIAGPLRFLAHHSTLASVPYGVGLGSEVRLLVAAGAVAAIP